VRLFESGSILIHLAEKFGAFLPASGPARAEVLNWLMWQMGSAPFIGGGFGHFYAYAPVKIEYAINRYAMETKRLLDVANRRLAESRFLGGEDYSIADMAAFPGWAGCLGLSYPGAQTFLSLADYEHLGPLGEGDFCARAGAPGPRGEQPQGLAERHSAADFATLSAEAAELGL
jgi:GST-like protein